MTSVSDDSVAEEIKRGRERGASKLILSGGEASTHPRFLEFVKLGAQHGYSKIQVITNGRMFAYRRFLEQAVCAGLTEMTVSIHGHDAALHDRLVAVPGAFNQAVRAVQQALPKLIVNIDVCLNRENVQHLQALLERFIALGVREFDLLHLIPFGRAFEHFDHLSYDIDEALPAIRRALELSRRSDIQIWLNRFPPQYLEGFEDLIQDPWKIHDEVRGREAELQRAVDTGEPLPCASPTRCQNCYMAGYCAALKQAQGWLKSGAAMLRVGPERTSNPALTCFDGAGYWIRARDAKEVHDTLGKLRTGKIWLELESYTAPDLRELIENCGSHPIERVFVSTPEELDLVLTVAGRFKVVALLTDSVTARFTSTPELPSLRVEFMQPAPSSLTDSIVPATRLRSVFRRLPAASVEGLPRCVTLRPERPAVPVVDCRSLTATGAIDPLGFVRQYIADFAYIIPRRCVACTESAHCRGIHVNAARAYGFSALTPFVESVECEDTCRVS